MKRFVLTMAMAPLMVFGETLQSALDTELSVSTGGNASWFAQSTSSHDGKAAAQSGVISDGQTTWMEMTVSGPADVSFWWNVSSEGNYDWLIFSVDGTQSDKISGSTGWRQKTIRISTGVHMLRWTYSKDYSLGSGSDCGWVDQLEVIPALPHDAVTWYVDGAAGSNSNTGRSASAAKKTIQAAIDAAYDGDTILVAAGTYAPISSSNKDIRIKSVSGAEVTIIDGENLSRCADLGSEQGQNATVLDGFTVRNGKTHSSPGAGVRCGRLFNCIVTCCTNTFGVFDSIGGGAWATIADGCTFVNNWATHGGGMSDGVADRCVFQSNHAEDDGGAVTCSFVRDSLIIGNESYNWGGSGSGGACLSSTNFNCTIVNNRAHSGGIFAGRNLVANCIVLNNFCESGSLVFAKVGTDETQFVSCFDAGDACFVDAANGDYRLSSDSPCIDAGDNAYVTSGTDLGGNARIVNGRVDIGCYEHVGVHEPILLYVDATHGSDDNSGRDSSAAKKTIQAAVDVAQDGDTILVAAGTYAPIVTFNKCILVKGLSGPESTTIDGHYQSNCVYAAVQENIEFSTNSHIVGFSLINGKASVGGGGIGGIYQGCIISNNHGVAAGGGIIKAIVRDCLLVNNTSKDGGGACDSLLIGCTFINNRADNNGGAAYDCAVVNCLEHGNSSGLDFGYDGGAYYDAHFTDSIGKLNGYIKKNNVSDGLHFVDSSRGDYRLTPDSPCIDAGDNAYVTDETDLAGNARIVNGRVDIGCYEYVGIHEPISFYVDATRGSDANSGYDSGAAKKTIQAAIDAAHEGDTIIVSPGAYDVFATANKAVVIKSTSGAETTFIDGGGASGARVELLDDTDATFISVNNKTNTVLVGFTVEHCEFIIGGTIRNCIVRNIDARAGGAPINMSIVENCLVLNNVGCNGGAGDNCIFRNCTIVGNRATSGYRCVALNCVLENCIVYGNADNSSGTWPEWLRPMISDIGYREANVFRDDPLFVDAESGDYRLRDDSPCIDMGNNSLVATETDLDGHARIANGRVDLGCYEKPAGGGLYMVVDLSGGPLAQRYPASYLNDVPNGGWSEEYKTDKLVLRRVDEGMTDRAFYIGVFELTQRQWELVMGSNPSYFTNMLYYATRPVEMVSYDMIRGDDIGAHYPDSNAVDPDSFMGRLRAKTDVVWDLPTLDEFVCASQAGQGRDITAGRGRFARGVLLDDDLSRDLTPSDRFGTDLVGSYEPNEWGLYDMLGNVQEWTLSLNDGRHAIVGGSWNRFESLASSAPSRVYDDWHAPDNKSFGEGFRVSCRRMASATHTLEVVQPDGTVITNVVAHGTNVELAAPAPLVDMDGKRQIVAIGSSYTVPVITNRFHVLVTNDTTVAWDVLTTNYWFATTVTVYGTIDAPSTGWKVEGAEFALTAMPDEHYHFVRWTGDVGGCVGSGNTLSVVMDRPRTIGAEFAINEFKVTFDLGGKGVRVGGGELEQTVAYGCAAVAPQLEANYGWVFLGWDGDFSSIVDNLNVSARWQKVWFEEKVGEVTWGYLLKDGVAVVDNNGNAAVSGMVEGEVVVPATLGGRPVRAIGSGAFAGCGDVETIVLPQNLVEVGEGAFAGCSNLVSVTLPEGVTAIPPRTFEGCAALEELVIPAGVQTIGDEAFAGCVLLKAVEIPEGVTEIAARTFAGCEKLSSVKLPESLERIGAEAFTGCAALGSVTIPANVSEIGENAFGDCRGLGSVRFYGQPPTGIWTSGLVNEKVTIHGPADVTISPADRTVFGTDLAVMLATSWAGGVVRYTLDGSAPTAESPVFDGITVHNKTTVRAATFVEGLRWSEIEEATYGVGKAATPTATSTQGGTFCHNGNRVSLDCATAGVEIRYTFGGEPTTDSTLYTGPFEISRTTTVKAKAFGHPDYVDSDVMTAEFVRTWEGLATPAISPEGGLIEAECELVTITCESEDVAIYYTLDGSRPSATNGRVYTKPFQLYQSATVRAIATKFDWADSEVASVTFTREDRLGEALNYYGGQVMNDVDHPWTVDSAESHDGMMSAKSALSVKGEASMSLLVYGAGRLTFWWRASCEAPYKDNYSACGSFRADDREAVRIAGETEWRLFSADFTDDARHVLTWTYAKTDSFKTGKDCIWVDQVVWIPSDDSGKTLTTGVPVPYSWLEGHGLGVATDFETAANAKTGKRTAFGKELTVWEDYVMGTDPTNPDSVFRTFIDLSSGVPKVTWEPDLNENGTKHEREYQIWGAKSLDGQWFKVDGDERAYNFFKVTVDTVDLL